MLNPTIDPGRPHHRDVAESSWWPKQSTWNESGLDVGIWTNRNEEWFQRTLHTYRQGPFDEKWGPKKAKDWRNVLKQERTMVRTFLDNLEVFASRAL